MHERLTRAIRGEKLLLGVVHLPPLPGSPRYAGQPLTAIAAQARKDAETLLDAGFDGWVLENFGDLPFFADTVPAYVPAAMTRVACDLPRQAFTVVNVLRNDAAAALAVAAAAGLQAIRVNVHAGAMVTDQGLIEGRAAQTLRLRRELGLRTAILADVHVKHAWPLGQGADIRDAASDIAHRGLADALIVSGKATGSPACREDVEAVRAAVSDRAILVGSGTSAESIREWMRIADGAIVGTSIKEHGHVELEVDSERARRFIGEARS